MVSDTPAGHTGRAHWPGTLAGHTGKVFDPSASPDVVRSVRALSDDDLHTLAEVVRQVQIERAIDNGDHDAIIAAGFESGFGRDGLGVLSWVEGSVIV